MRSKFLLSLLLLSRIFLFDVHCSEFVNLSGYVKTLETTTNSQNRILGLSANRLRLKLEAKSPQQKFTGQWVSDQEYFFGSLLRSQRKNLETLIRPNELFELDWDLNEKETTLWRQRFHRLFATWREEAIELTVGRQRIAWGQGRLWNPTDGINPYNPTSIEREERSGSDAVDLKWNFASLSRVEAVYVPRRSLLWSESYLSAKATINYKEMDHSLMGGKNGSEKWVGFDHSSQFWEGSFRGDVTYTFDSTINADSKVRDSLLRESLVRQNFWRGVVSYDRSFGVARPLYTLVEFFYNGLGEKQYPDYKRVVFKSSDLPFFAQEYLGFGITWDVAALWKMENYTIFNVNDLSTFWGPRIRYQPWTNIEFVAGGQCFAGSSQSEYGNIDNIGFLHAMIYF